MTLKHWCNARTNYTVRNRLNIYGIKSKDNFIQFGKMSEDYFKLLPPELITAIYSYLNYEDILKLSQTDKRLNELCKDPKLWKSLIYARFP